MFKVGEKVVFVDTDTLPRNIDVKYLEIGEIVTISKIINHDSFKYPIILLNEYPTPLNGGSINGILSICFRKLEHKFADDILENIIEKIKEEQLIES